MPSCLPSSLLLPYQFVRRTDLPPTARSYSPVASPPLTSGFHVELVSHWSAAPLVVGKPSPAEPRVVKMHLFLRMTARSGPAPAGEAVGTRAAAAVPAREECDAAAGPWPWIAAGQCRPLPLSDRRTPSERPPDEIRKVGVSMRWTLDFNESYLFQLFVGVFDTCLVWNLLVLPSEWQAATRMTSLRTTDGNTSYHSCGSFSLWPAVLMTSGNARTLLLYDDDWCWQLEWGIYRPSCPPNSSSLFASQLLKKRDEQLELETMTAP